MKELVCVNYRKLNTVMKEFLEKASSGLTCTREYLPGNLELEKMGVSFEEAFFDEKYWKKEEVKKEIVLRKGKRFCACIDDPEIIEIRYNISSLLSKGQKQFRQDITFRSPRTKGFANITLSLLHELGHCATEDFDFGNYDRDEMLKVIGQSLPREFVNFAYFLLPDEYAATEWAINWLEDAENRKIAKNFERDFFNLFEKIS